jgi:hypothetical protein
VNFIIPGLVEREISSYISSVGLSYGVGGDKVMKENYYALLICIFRSDFNIDRSTTYMLNGRMRKNLPKGEGNEEMIQMKQQGMTHREIGEIFGLTPEAVYRRIKRSKEVMSRGKG